MTQIKTRVCTLRTHTRVSPSIDILTIDLIPVKHGKRSVSTRSPILWVGRSGSNSCPRRNDDGWLAPPNDAWGVTAGAQAEAPRNGTCTANGNADVKC